MAAEGPTTDAQARGELLAALLSGDLDPAAATDLRGELARDPAARAQLESIRLLDERLADLPAVAPSAAFSASLRAAVAAEVAGTPVDELARRRTPSPWVRRLGIGAAAAGLIGVIGLGISQFGGDNGGSAEPTSAAGLAADSGMAEEMRSASATPITITDIDYAEAALLALPDENGPFWRELVSSILARQADIQDLQDEQIQLFGLRFEPNRKSVTAIDAPPPVTADGAQADQGSASTGGTTESAPAAQAQLERTDPAQAFNDVRRCLPQLLEGANGPAIPVHAEVARYEGEPVVIYVLAVEDPSTGEHSRLEMFVVARSDCFTRYFAQL